MKVLITGSNGFIAKNLIQELKMDDEIQLYTFSKSDSIELLKEYLEKVDFIFHLAGVNRPEDINEFYEGNSGLTKQIVEVLVSLDKKVPILLSSSIQAELDNDYGKSKLEAENILLRYSKDYEVPVYIYRLQNVFGRWCKPNYNSVIATWCHNIANNLEIQVNNKETQLSLVYIDDVVSSFIGRLDSDTIERYFEIQKVYQKTLGEIETLLYKFKHEKASFSLVECESEFEKALYTTYASYL